MSNCFLNLKSFHTHIIQYGKYDESIIINDNVNRICSRKQKSVIEPKCSSKYPVELQEMDCNKSEEIGQLIEKRDTSKKEEEADDIIVDETAFKMRFDDVVDILAINTMCAKSLIQEENNYLARLRSTFESAWHEINLGESIMEECITFCQRRGEISYAYFESLNRQFR